MSETIWSPTRVGTAEGGDALSIHSYEELAALHAIARILGGPQDLREQFKAILKELSCRLGMERGMISLIDRETGRVWLDVAHQINIKGLEISYQPGEGITGKVAQTGRPMAVENLGREMHFLDRTGARRYLDRSELSFLCVPIIYDSRVVGVLSADKMTRRVVNIERELAILSSVAELIAKAVQMRALEEENRRLLRVVGRAGRLGATDIIGHSRAMQEVFGLISQVADSNITVLIHGETGTGKELVAREIHRQSQRREGPMVCVNCAAIPDTLMESELFGHEKGAFTGALQKRKGRFEEAHGGTIFLDEVGELSAAAQAKLLRVLQEKQFQPLGSSRLLTVNVRVVAATNRNLERDIEAGLFRKDLYYRLNVFPIHLPPLCQRGSDIILLADNFIAKYAKELGKSVRRLSPQVIEIFLSYPWPGNVRELENCIERAILLAGGDTIEVAHLPPAMQLKPRVESEASADGQGDDTDLSRVIASKEMALIIDALKASRGNQSEAAKSLKVTKRILQYKVKKYGIDPWRFRTKTQKH